MLNLQQNLIEQVLMIDGNFLEDAGIELIDRFKQAVIQPAKVVNQITLQPRGSNTSLIYLFALLPSS